MDSSSSLPPKSLLSEPGASIIRASNVDRLQTELKLSKKAGAHKRSLLQMLDGDDDKGKGKKEPKEKEPKKPKITAAEVKMTQHLYGKEQKAKAASNAAIRTKLDKIARYENSALLWPIIRNGGDKNLLASKPTAEAEVDRKLNHIRDVLSSQKADEHILKAVVGGATLVEKVTKEGELIGMQLQGFADTVYACREGMAQELEEIKCEHGGIFKTPWYFRLPAFFVGVAKSVDARNRSLCNTEGHLQE
jgi:hypothetical protein